MQIRKLFPAAVLCLLLLPVAASAQVGQVGIEYIAHACFVVESPGGTRVLIDPYNGNRWLGYSFPEEVAADAVLITHPHYDHDADYYRGPGVPVLRAPGRYEIGDVRVEGVRGKHADPYGKDFGQINTLWVVEAGGVRIAHLGDTGPLTEENVRALGRVDVLMIPLDGLYHILTREQIDGIRAALRPRVTIPMHYRISGLTQLPKSLGPIEPWLEGRANVDRLNGNRKILRRESLRESERILVFSPSPRVKPWRKELFAAWAKAQEARGLGAAPEDRRKAIDLMRGASELAPDVIVFSWGLAGALAVMGEGEEAIRVLERALAGAGQSDWEFRMKSRALLARLYEASGNLPAAARQYRLILAGSHRTELLDQARQFFRKNSPGGGL